MLSEACNSVELYSANAVKGEYHAAKLTGMLL
jgi:hypothetical protein